MTQASDVQASRPPLGGIVWDIVLNAVIPVIFYKLSKRYVSPSEFTALLVATTFPLGKSIFDLMRRRLVDPISIVVLLGIAASCIALLFGGSPRLLLIRESLFTGAFGVACFVSLLLPRPMMFYFARHFIAGTDPQRLAQFNAGWQLPEVRFCHRLITVVWGCTFVGELVLRIVLIYHTSPATVLFVSPILLGSLTLVTIVWAFSYGHRVRLRALAQLAQRKPLVHAGSSASIIGTRGFCRGMACHARLTCLAHAGPSASRELRRRFSSVASVRSQRPLW